MPDVLPNELSAGFRQDNCRRYVDSAEAWLRRLVHLALIDKFGADYITGGSGRWKKSLVDHVSTKKREAPEKYQREVDGTTLEQLIDIVCHPQAWLLFKDGLIEAYPDGVAEARTFLDRIRSIRNDVSHGRQCSVRQLERAICYSNDIADSVKSYFEALNMTREFNVPTFVTCNDNVGNSEQISPGAYYRAIDLSGANKKRLYPGDILVAEMEVDPSFEGAGYDVEWCLKTQPGARGSGKLARIEITTKHVGERLELQFKLKTKKDWHRDSGGYDDLVDLYYKVLPPPG